MLSNFVPHYCILLFEEPNWSMRKSVPVRFRPKKFSFCRQKKKNVKKMSWSKKQLRRKKWKESAKRERYSFRKLWQISRSNGSKWLHCSNLTITSCFFHSIFIACFTGARSKKERRTISRKVKKYWRKEVCCPRMCLLMCKWLRVLMLRIC